MTFRLLPNQTLQHVAVSLAAILALYESTIANEIGLDLTIVFQSDRQFQSQEAWMKSCQSLKTLLEQGSGFRPIHCRPRPVTDNLEAMTQMTQSSWILRITDHRDLSAADVFFRESGTLSWEARYNSQGSPSYLKALEDPKFVGALVPLLLNQLPFVGALRLSPGQPQIQLSPMTKTATTKHLLVYELFYDPAIKQWRPKVVGRAFRSSQDLWALRLRTGHITPEKTYYIHDVKGRHSKQDDLIAKLEDQSRGYGLASIFDDLFSAFSSSFGGVRYGFPLLPSETAIGQSTMFGSFLEMRSGFLEGFRIYYDMAPETVILNNQGREESFSWSRPSIGWAFELGVPSFLEPFFTRLDVSAKYGILSLAYNFYIEDSFGEQFPVEYKTDGTLSGGIEIGLEKDIDVMLLRAWAGYDQAGLLVSNSDVVSTSLKAGMDAYLDLISFGKNSKIRGLAFILAESMSISKPPPENPSNEATVEDLELSLVFLGGGLTLSW